MSFTLQRSFRWAAYICVYRHVLWAFVHFILEGFAWHDCSHACFPLLHLKPVYYVVTILRRPFHVLHCQLDRTGNYFMPHYTSWLSRVCALLWSCIAPPVKCNLHKLLTGIILSVNRPSECSFVKFISKCSREPTDINRNIWSTFVVKAECVK